MLVLYLRCVDENWVDIPKYKVMLMVTYSNPSLPWPVLHSQTPPLVLHPVTDRACCAKLFLTNNYLRQYMHACVVLIDDVIIMWVCQMRC
jgi:hypothetical protein